ncbi:hypothetical protein [Pantoea sp. At-9b]|uniref:hypothetical protein n=1 Tax=Pantoea sp. (strain At-9b) TaxID=592316 RepID=UPI0001B3EAF9|nr:hypothetical protein [Pantoea sp. At-9b]ADU68210.1 hypothetical protein Pat9b_0886 [Pantoea sp. At-9b]
MSFTSVYRLPPGIIRHCFNPGPVQVIPVLNNAIKFIDHNCACLSSNHCAKHTVNQGLKELQPVNKHWFMKNTPPLPRLVGVPGSVKLTGNAVTPCSAGTLKKGKESGGEKVNLNNLWACYSEKLKSSSAELNTTLFAVEHADSGVESLSASASEGAVTPETLFVTNWDNLGEDSFLVQKEPEQSEHNYDSGERNEPAKPNPFRAIVTANAGTFSDKRAWQFGEKFDNYYPECETIKEEPSSQTPVDTTSVRRDTVVIIDEKIKVKNTLNIYGIKKDDLYEEAATRL